MGGRCARLPPVCVQGAAGTPCRQRQGVPRGSAPSPCRIKPQMDTDKHRFPRPRLGSALLGGWSPGGGRDSRPEKLRLGYGFGRPALWRSSSCSTCLVSITIRRTTTRTMRCRSAEGLCFCNLDSHFGVCTLKAAAAGCREVNDGITAGRWRRRGGIWKARNKQGTS